MSGIPPEVAELSRDAVKRLRDRVADLDDEEFWWEPARDCWRLFRDGSGGDFGLVFTEEPPVTTLGWRVAHVVDILKEDRTPLALGIPVPAIAQHEWIPTCADDARRMLAEAGDAFDGYLTHPDAKADGFAFVLHMVDEVIHHGAEIALLRDLYRAQQPRDEIASALLRGDLRLANTRVDRMTALKTERPDLVVEAAATARWDAIPLLLDLGFAIEGTTGRSALHHAAAAGRLDLVQFLVHRGADIGATDPVYNATPKVWAEFFGQTEVASYLEAAALNADGQ